MDLLGKSLCDIKNKSLQRILTRAQSFNFDPHHVPGASNQIADCLSRLCGVISRTAHAHTHDDNIRLLPMLKKVQFIRRN